VETVARVSLFHEKLLHVGETKRVTRRLLDLEVLNDCTVSAGASRLVQTFAQ